MGETSSWEAINSSTETSVTSLDEDSLAKCFSYLTIKDISNLSMSSKFFKHVAYSNSIWLRFFREQWTGEAVPSSSQVYGMREAYLARFEAVNRLGFCDPKVVDIPGNYADLRPIDNILLDNHELVFSQGSSIYRSTIDELLNVNVSGFLLNDHKARITCMRLFPLQETSVFRSATQRKGNILITSICDHTIHLFWQGAHQRCFKGHNGPVTTLSDKLLDPGGSKLLASGGEDGTVRLWSLSSNGKRGQHTPKATLYGHQKPVKLITVAEYKHSLLATISTDSKVRVWDATVSSAVRSSCCVGMTCAHGLPIYMKCHESLLFIAAGSSVEAIDLRTMQKVITADSCEPKLYSAAVLPSKSLICTGGYKKAMIWDIRKATGSLKPETVAELDGHFGPVTQLHMDRYKVVTGGPEDLSVMVWDPNTGRQMNIISWSSETGYHLIDAVAVNGSRIAIAISDQGSGVVSLRDFFNATRLISDCFNDDPSEKEDEFGSKFWNPDPYNDDDMLDLWTSNMY